MAETKREAKTRTKTKDKTVSEKKGTSEGGLFIDNMNRIIECIHVIADENRIAETCMSVNANDMMAMCGGCKLVRIIGGRIADIDVWVVAQDRDSAQKVQYTVPGANKVLVIGRTAEDNIGGSCVIAKREGRCIRSLSYGERRLIMETGAIYQFTKDGVQTSMCLTGFERC